MEPNHRMPKHLPILLCQKTCGRGVMTQVQVIERLTDAPCIADELPTGFLRMSVRYREKIRKIKVSGNRAHTLGHGGLKTVYYIAGDERRAAKKFIDENREAITQVGASQYSILNSNLDKEMVAEIRGLL